MCGIAGWLGRQPQDEECASRVARALRHRGPDGHGAESWPKATLVHTRLKIIDLSPAGAQPMSNEDGTVWVVFNGEIYNHRELRRWLEGRGHVFRGHSDTEVLPHLYEEEGEEFVQRLRGMFALAVYDLRRQTMLLARDRFGIKPLFYAPGPDRLAFASEINALLEVPGIDLSTNRQAVYDFAALFYVPAPETFYSGVHALLPGELLTAALRGGEVSWRTRAYHRWVVAPDAGMGLGDAAGRADELVALAVRRQLESDVPLGALLSGGIDSSLVSVAAQEAVGGQLQTFNVRFPDEQYDETWAALAVADHIKSRHQTLDMGETEGSWEKVCDLLGQAGQPFADTSLFAVNGVSRLMRRHVTVALSGDGGDEGFGGYNNFWQIERIARWQRLPSPFWKGAPLALRPLARLGLVPEHMPRRLGEFNGADDTAVMQNLFCWVRDDEHARLCLDTDLLPVRRWFEPRWEYRPPRGGSRLERISAHTTEINVRMSLPNDYLFKVDTASMKESLEVRVPLLDEDLFAFGLTLPHNMKVKGRTCKRVLREVAGRRLPPAVAEKPKWGFGIPVDKWVDSDFKARLRETLLGDMSVLREFFRPESYKPVIEAFCGGEACDGISRLGLYQRIIMLLSVHVASAARHPARLRETVTPLEPLTQGSWT